MKSISIFSRSISTTKWKLSISIPTIRDPEVSRKGAKPQRRNEVRLGVLASLREIRLSDFCYAPLSWETLKLRRIVTGHNAGGGAGQRDHALLGLEIRRHVGGIERGAGAMRLKILVEVAIVGRQHVGRVARYADILG